MATVSPTKTEWMIYGANGYTGHLIAEEAVRRGMHPIIAGRNRQAVTKIAEQLGCRSRVFDLSTIERTRSHLADCRLVLNCAGPFSATAQPMIAGALAAQTHYLDITGEIACLEAAAAQHDEAVAAGVALIPAMGFDVVPSDCLAAQVAMRVAEPTHLELAIHSRGAISSGTAKTMIEALPDGGRARIAGRIEKVPTAWKVREIPFPDEPHWAMTIPWGDISTAYHSTGIPNIEVYATAPRQSIQWIRRLRFLAPLARPAVVQRWLKKLAATRLPGPTEEQRQSDRVMLWARVTGRDHQAAEATLETPEGYTLTVLTALGAVERLLASEPPPGFSTPSRAFGRDFIEQFEQVQLQFHTPATV